VSGLSVFDAFCFGLFAVGSLLDLKQFPLSKPSDERNVTLKTTVIAYKSAFPSENITTNIGNLQSSQVNKDLSSIRNVLAHRAVPARQFYISAGSATAEPSAEIQRLGLKLDPNTTASRRSDLAKLLSSLMSKAEAFANAHF
jgi:hypothetical protein